MKGLKHRNISHLSCRALVAVMVLSGWSSVGGIGEALGLKSTDKSCITALESANARLNLDAPITRQSFTHEEEPPHFGSNKHQPVNSRRGSNQRRPVQSMSAGFQQL